MVPSPQTLGGGTVRMVLTVPDPNTVFDRALAAGATQVHAVTEEYGWRVGRLVDPFGHHWEVGRHCDDAPIPVTVHSMHAGAILRALAS